jgi:hypothetical protein
MLPRAAAGRISLILFLICAVVCVHAVTVSSEPFHQHSSQHCCGLCHTGPLAFVEAAIDTGLLPVLSQAWLEQSHGSDPAHEILLAAGSSRAPPA